MRLPGRTSLNRPLALIAVGTAVALAATIVVVGMASGEDGSGVQQSSTLPLPAGHPSVASPSASPSPVDEVALTITRLERRCAAHPQNTALLLKLGDAYFLGQRFHLAEETFQTALERQPGNLTAKVKLAMVWHAQGRTGRAERSIEDVIESEPKHQEAHYALAIICFSEGRLDEAAAHWRIAAKIDPSSTIGRRSQSFVDLLKDTGSDDRQPD